MKQRILYFDILNVVACFSVVCLHCNGFVHSFIKDDWWWLRVLIEVACFFAVPVFFMLSGATLLDYRKKYSTKTFFKKRFTRTFIPFLVWSALFYSLSFITKGTEGETWREVVTNICIGKIPYTNYWFFIPLFLIYLFMPFLSLMSGSMKEKQILYLCILLGFFQTLLPTVLYLANIHLDMSLPFGSYVIYVFLGYYLAHSTIETDKRWMITLGLLALLSMVGRYILVYQASEETPEVFSYLGPYAVFPAIFIFLLFKKLFKGDKCAHPFWESLSSKSLGVYLIHTALISVIGKAIHREEVLFIPVAIASVYLLSVLMVYIMQKNRLLRHLVP